MKNIASATRASIATGVPHGHVVETWSDGTRYEGTFREGKFRDGHGVFNLRNGTRYEAEYRDGVPTADGVLICADGTRKKCPGFPCPKCPDNSDSDNSDSLSDELWNEALERL